MKGRNCWNVNFTICWRGLLPFGACESLRVCVCVFFFSCPFLIPCSSVLFHECAAILAVWSHGVSVSVALTGWKIQCHMVDGGDFPISFLFRACSPSGNPFFFISVPGFLLPTHAHLRNTLCCSLLLTWTCPSRLFLFRAHLKGPIQCVYLNGDDFNHHFTASRAHFYLSRFPHFKSIYQFIGGNVFTPLWPLFCFLLCYIYKPYRILVWFYVIDQDKVFHYCEVERKGFMVLTSFWLSELPRLKISLHEPE